MEPFSLIAGLLGAGGSIAGGFMGADAQERNSERNWQINLLNYYQRERERYEQIQEAQRQEKKRDLGTTDSRGNRTHFVPGKGWVTDMSASGQEMQDLQDKEQRNVLTQDLPARRKQMFQNLADAMSARYNAKGVEDALKRPDESHRDAAARTMLDAESGVNQEYDGLENQLARTNLRTGGNQFANIAAAMAKARMNTIAQNKGQLSMAAEDARDRSVATKKAGLLNLLGGLQARGAGMPQVNYAPQNISGNADKFLAGDQAASANAGNIITQSFGKKGGTMDYTEPDYGYANAVSGAGQSLGELFKNIGANRERYGNNVAGGTGSLW